MVQPGKVRGRWIKVSFGKDGGRSMKKATSYWFTTFIGRLDSLSFSAGPTRNRRSIWLDVDCSEIV